MTRLGLWLAAAAALLVSGCAGAASVAEPASAAHPQPAAQPESAVDLPASAVPTPCPTQDATHLPDGAAPASAYLCSSEIAAVAGDGEWMFAVTRRVTEGLPRLLKAYRTPDADRTDGPCLMDLPDPRVVWFQLGETPVPVRAPYDGCAKPIPEATAAYDALVTVVEERRPVAQVRSQLAVDTGCAQEWKDVLAIEAADSHPVPTVAPTSLSGTVRACGYDVVGDWVGRLSAGRILSPDELKSVNAALAQARPDADCRRDGHRRFVVLLPVDGEPTYVALDGCAVAQGSAWWRADDALRRALTG